jgi:hypothetical protein
MLIARLEIVEAVFIVAPLWLFKGEMELTLSAILTFLVLHPKSSLIYVSEAFLLK